MTRPGNMPENSAGGMGYYDKEVFNPREIFLPPPPTLPRVGRGSIGSGGKLDLRSMAPT